MYINYATAIIDRYYPASIHISKTSMPFLLLAIDILIRSLIAITRTAQARRRRRRSSKRRHHAVPRRAVRRTSSVGEGPGSASPAHRTNISQQPSYS